MYKAHHNRLDKYQVGIRPCSPSNALSKFKVLNTILPYLCIILWLGTSHCDSGSFNFSLKFLTSYLLRRRLSARITCAFEYFFARQVVMLVECINNFWNLFSAIMVSSSWNNIHLISGEHESWTYLYPEQGINRLVTNYCYYWHVTTIFIDPHQKMSS